jgi:hypothetical protein
VTGRGLDLLLTFLVFVTRPQPCFLVPYGKCLVVMARGVLMPWRGKGARLLLKIRCKWMGNALSHLRQCQTHLIPYWLGYH